MATAEIQVERFDMLRPWEKLDAFAVEVRVALGNDTYRHGSGYVVAPFRILTALHVLVGPRDIRGDTVVTIPGRVEVRVLGDFLDRFGRTDDVVIDRTLERVRRIASGDYLWRPAELLWPPIGHPIPPFELAVLKIDAGDALRCARNAPRTKTLTPTFDIACRGTGFAQWTTVHTEYGDVLANPGTVTGILTCGATRYRSYHAFTPSNGAPADEGQWMGLSGAAFFDVETQRLVGVASEARRDVVPNGLWLTRLADLKGPEFTQFWAASGIPLPMPPPIDDSITFKAPLDEVDFSLDLPGEHPYAPLQMAAFPSAVNDQHLTASQFFERIHSQKSLPLIIIGDTRQDLIDVLHQVLLTDPNWSPAEFIETVWVRLARCGIDTLYTQLIDVVGPSVSRVIFDFSDFTPNDSSFTDFWAVFQSNMELTKYLSDAIVALPRWFAMRQPVLDWLKVQPSVYRMAHRYSLTNSFRATPFAELPDDKIFSHAIIALLHANSNTLRPMVRKALASMSKRSDLSPHERAINLSEHMFRHGYWEEALRLEKYMLARERTRGYLVALSADVESLDEERAGTYDGLAYGRDSLCGFLRDAIDCPRVGRRIVLTGEAGAGKTTTTLRLEEHWSLPVLDSQSLFPILLKIGTGAEGLGVTLQRALAASTLVPRGSRFLQFPLFAHISLSQYVTPMILSAMIASPIVYIIDGITEESWSRVSSWFEELNSVGSETRIVASTRASELKRNRVEAWKNYGPVGQTIVVSLRSLEVDQLDQLCRMYNIAPTYGNQVIVPDVFAARALRNPYLCTQLLSVVRSGTSPKEYNTYHIIDAYVTLLTNSNDDLPIVLYEVLPRAAYQNKLGAAVEVGQRAHEAAVEVGLLDHSSTPESPIFTHRLLEDFFASIFVAEQLHAGQDPQNLLSGNQRLWRNRWEYLLRMLVGQLAESGRQKLLDYIAARDLRLASECILELDPSVIADSTDVTKLRGQLAGRIAQRIISPAEIEEALADGIALGHLDPRVNRPEAMPDLVEVPKSQTEIRHLIGRYPVTNFEFAKFVRAKGYDRREYWPDENAWNWRKDVRYPRYWNQERLNVANAPVVGVNFFEAQAYCEWLSREADTWHEPMSFFVPLTKDWDVASGVVDDDLWSSVQQTFSVLTRGPDRLDLLTAETALAPLFAQITRAGAKFEREVSFNRRKRAAAVPRPIGLFPPSQSGCFDMIGHVWEWCIWADHEFDPNNWHAVVKGGPLWNQEALTSAVIGSVFDPYTRFYQVGFRVGAVRRN